MDRLLQDLRYAFRSLVRQPGFALVAILTLALGIGATAAIFSVVHAVLLRPLPYPNPDQLVAISEVNHRDTFSRLADPNFDDFRAQSRTFHSMAKYGAGTVSVLGMAEPTRAQVAVVSRDFLTVLGTQPAIGRGFAASDAHPDATPVAVVSFEYWQRHLAAARDLSNLTLRIEGRIYTVVGVMPEGFAFPGKTDVWRPAELDAENTSRTSHNYLAIGRLNDGATVAQASADLSAIARRIVQHSSEQGDYLMKDAAAIPLQASLTGRVRSPLYILLGAVGFLLLIACANVANLLLEKAAARGRELAVRNALGAGRGRLVRQFIAESLLLSAIGCGGGLLIAVGAVRGLLRVVPEDLPRAGEVAVSWPVLGFAAGVALLVAVGLGVFTALRSTSGDLRSTLVEGGRGSAGAPGGQRINRAIVGAQLAITVVLLVGAGLLGRSLLQVLAVDPGFRTDNLVTMDLQLPSASATTPEAQAALRARSSQRLAKLIERLHAIPRMQEVAAVNAVPLDGGLPDGMFLLIRPRENPASFAELRALARQTERRGVADFCAASAEYFQALGIPLVRGRLFDARDAFDAPHVAVISQSLARARWPSQDPIGQTIQFGNMDGDLHLLTIVGIVGDTHEYGLEQAPRPTVYVNMLQRPRSYLTVVMHTGAEPPSVVATARVLLRDEAPDVAPRFRTFAQIYSASLGSRRFNLTLVGAFAASALILAVAGIYGVMAYAVAQRTREIGVRMALGARSRDVLGMILGQGLRTILLGVVAGAGGALALTRAIQSLLFAVEPADPLTFVAVTALLVGVATLACYVPARRATRVDPMVTLRYE
jgi:predicted permease